MRRIRVIPLLLIQNDGLVKSIRFKKHQYVGDPINAVKIFNEKEVDEIAIIDISATREKNVPNIKMLQEISGEAFMPLSFGGGIKTVDQAKEILFHGAEKVILNTSAIDDPKLISEIAGQFGNQSVVISIDVKKDFFGRYRIFRDNGSKKTNLDLIKFVKQMENVGAGEILLSSVDNDGTYNGYDLDLIKKVSEQVSIPIVSVGGASEVLDFKKAILNGASAVAAGSMFVFKRPHQAVLISYPSQEELVENLFKKIK